ncbi:hypothetical protein GCM10023320_23760 [Pseudonocardia adelaidensis]|uniref:Uncharacterized protein n=1 Tax=Pseudonocardia adelaidensis TaxID=648754 RepID=A0ABP9NI47_9PSEU
MLSPARLVGAYAAVRALPGTCGWRHQGQQHALQAHDRALGQPAEAADERPQDSKSCDPMATGHDRAPTVAARRAPHEVAQWNTAARADRRATDALFSPAELGSHTALHNPTHAPEPSHVPAGLEPAVPVTPGEPTPRSRETDQIVSPPELDGSSRGQVP